jgi:hypothetical protein
VTALDYALTLPTGTAVLVTKAEITVATRLAAEAAAFVAAGQAAGRRYTRKISAAAGSLATTGFGAGLLRNYRLNSDNGSFTLAGQSALFTNQSAVIGAAGAFNLSGLDGALTYTPAPVTDWSVTAANGSPFLGSTTATSTTGWTTQVSSYVDDGSTITGSFGFTFTLAGNAYTACYVSSNGLLSFGAGSVTTSPGPSTPSVPKLIFYGGDRSYRRVYTRGSTYNGKKFFKIRWEGYNSYQNVAANTFIEITLFERLSSATNQYVEVRLGNAVGPNSLRLASASAYYAQVLYPEANKSYVFTGNATGTSWSASEASSIDHSF